MKTADRHEEIEEESTSIRTRLSALGYGVPAVFREPGDLASPRYSIDRDVLLSLLGVAENERAARG